MIDPMPGAWRAKMLAQQLAGVRVDQPDMQVVPLHVDVAADPAGRCAVVRRLDLDAAIEMDRPDAEPVIAKRLEGKWPERRPLFGKHRRHLPFGRAMNAGVRPVRVPAIEIACASSSGSKRSPRSGVFCSSMACNVRQADMARET
jgi:hypothetical protein